jgi:hypothetical protein
MKKLDNNIRYDLILGSRRYSNYVWGLLTFIGGLGFLLTGFSSYVGINLIPFLDSSDIVFIPQGIVMTFYGTIGSLLSLFLWIIIFFNVGGGYNSYNLKTQEITIFRVGFPGLQNEIYLRYLLRDVKSIKLAITEGLNPKREIYLITKDKKQIPLTRVGEPLLLSKIEEEAVNLANFLKINLES